MTNPSNILIDGSKFGLDWLKIYWYGALIVVGILLAYILCSHEAKRRNLHKDCVIDLVLMVVPIGAIFARIYYIVFALDAFIRPGMSFGQIVLGMLNFRDGGLAIYGAIIGGVLGMLIYGRVKRMHFLSITDLIRPSAAGAISSIRRLMAGSSPKGSRLISRLPSGSTNAISPAAPICPQT